VQPSYPSRAVRFFFCTVFCLALLRLHGSGYAQSPSPDPADTSSTIRVSSQFVILDALAENKQTGSLAGNLQLNDFRLSEDGVPQTITYFSQDRLPLSVVFLFDLTDTVRPALKPLAAGAREILGHLKPEDEVAIMVFSSHTELLQTFTTDRTLAADAIAKASDMQSKDGTFIHESMYEAVNQAMQSTTPGSRRVMIWLSDGTANFENSLTVKTIGKEAPAHLHTKEEATAALLRSGVVVSALIDRTPATDMTLMIVDANPFAMMFGGRTGDIRKYAELTGGPVLDTSKKEIADRLAALVDQIRMRYTIGYKPSMAKPEGTYCKLQLKLNPEELKTRADLRKLRILTRQGYYR
jgi:VWFA-related protein